MKIRIVSSLLALIFLSGCSSVLEPNTHELDADKLMATEKYADALNLIEPAARKGLPWAELRLGIAYEYGQGKQQSYADALQWYSKAAMQMKENAWADGLTLLSTGEDGFFNQNNDAKVAQYLIARIYSVGGYGIQANLHESWLWAQYAKQKSQQADILYCCENSILGKKKIEYERITQLIETLEKKLTKNELAALVQKQRNWKPYLITLP